MYEQSVRDGAATGARKAVFLKRNPVGYFIASMLAGVYVGLGIILIFAIGAPFAQAEHPAIKLIMGASFGLALTLVVFAGSELYTGNVLFLGLGRLHGTCSWQDVAGVWTVSWFGNLAGSLVLAWVAVSAGSIAGAMPFIAKVAGSKMAVGPWALIGRGLLCNLLVCLALWTSSRTKSDTAKILLIGWCLFGFIGSGYEHSIANMTLLGLGVLGQSGSAVGWGGFWYNVLWVTIGNTACGLLLAGAYHLATRDATRLPEEQPS